MFFCLEAKDLLSEDQWLFSKDPNSKLSLKSRHSGTRFFLHMHAVIYVELFPSSLEKCTNSKKAILVL